MSTLEILGKEHNEILTKIHFIETHIISELRETLDQYPEFVKEFSQFVKTNLAYHFKVEEKTLPCIKK